MHTASPACAASNTTSPSSTTANRAHPVQMPARQRLRQKLRCVGQSHHRRTVRSTSPTMAGQPEGILSLERLTVAPLFTQPSFNGLQILPFLLPLAAKLLADGTLPAPVYEADVMVVALSPPPPDDNVAPAAVVSVVTEDASARVAQSLAIADS
uniref:Uncharacterized protein n=1 Tax=Anopheles melas TaxID=34690 RepID=A0A182TRZ4_9DIPT